MKRPLFAAIVSVLLGCSTDPMQTSGGTSSSGNGITATIRCVDGTPASGATVRLRRSDYVTPIPSLAKSTLYGANALTDSNGRFEITGVDPGSYRIEVFAPSTAESQGGTVLFDCNLKAGDTTDLGTTLLHPFAAIAGKIDTAVRSTAPRYVQVAGLERLAEVDSRGNFAFNNLPSALLNLRIVSDEWSVDIANVRTESACTTSVTASSARQFARLLYLNTTETGASIAEDVLDFPLLIRLDSAVFDFSQAAEDGSDVYFAKENGTPLPHVIEQWDRARGRTALWVRVDTVHAHAADRFLTMQWGASTGAIVPSLSNGPAVFDTALGFMGVWQMSDSFGSTSISDRTARSSHGRQSGPLSTAPGIAGEARVFNGIDNAIVCNVNVFGLGLSSVTLSAWVKTTDTATQPILSYQNNLRRLRVAMEDRVWFGLLPANTTWLEMPSSGYLPQSPRVANGQWNLLTVAYDRSGFARVFVNGTPYDSLDISSTSQVNLSADSLVIGHDNFIPGYFHGSLDEVRVETRIRSRAWVKLCWESQRIDQTMVRFY